MAGFVFEWNFSFSDGEKVIKKGDFIKSHEDTVDGGFTGVVGKHFIDTLNGVIAKGDIAKLIEGQGVKEAKPFKPEIKAPPKPMTLPIKKGMTTTKKVK